MGTIFGFPAPAFPILIEKEDITDERTIVATANQFGWIVSSMSLAATVSCIPTALLLNWAGRKTTILLLFFPLLIGWTLIITATSINSYYVGRVFLGVAVGGNCMAIPVYCSEIAQKEIRGTVGSYFQLMINIGILFIYSIGYALSIQHMSVISLAVSVIITAGLMLAPESPTYLVKKGNFRIAEKSLKWLHGGGFDSKSRVEEMKAELVNLQNQSSGFRQIIGRRSTIHGLLIVIGIMTFFQMSGINAVIFYTSKIFIVSLFYFLSV